MRAAGDPAAPTQEPHHAPSASEEGKRFRTNTLFRYTPGTNSWTTLAPIPQSSADGATVAIDGKLYVYVTHETEGALGAALFRYDPATNQWSDRALPPAARDGAAARAIDGRIYVAGGFHGGSATSLATEVYDPATARWTERAGLRSRQAPRRSAAAPA